MLIRQDEQMIVNGMWSQCGYGFKCYKREWNAVFKCECGTLRVLKISQVLKGKTMSCGCARSQQMKGNRNGLSHGKTGTAVYTAWENIIQRCGNPKSPKFHHYGGRGIKVCETWQNSFAAFYADMGDPPSNNHSIDRINNDGNYEPTNCRWATKAQQQSNKRTNVILNIDGVEKTTKEWAQSEGAVSYSCLRARLRRGWPDKEAVFGKTNK